jgi:hypothetical protein
LEIQLNSKNSDEIAKLLKSDNESDHCSEKTMEVDEINTVIESKLDESINLTSQFC